MTGVLPASALAQETAGRADRAAVRAVRGARVHAYLLGEDGLGTALEISSALPMITAGADVFVAQGLIASR